ncbi:unnamed protein product [Euphydryas editha]|uniref:DDE-1 domain-containing protein n=1 Tax=Euphydryas editha TaxID=104508 RepID=A0AAU9TMJ7_EUPED|nr:unnamed protein product [Euphydryas editha]
MPRNYIKKKQTYTQQNLAAAIQKYHAWNWLGEHHRADMQAPCASGKKLPPLIVFKGKFVWNQWMADLDSVDYSAKGRMEIYIFFNYVEKVLIPNIRGQRPVLVIYDGHSTHVDVRVVQLAIQNDIILKLPPHTSHLLQPMDSAVKFKGPSTLKQYMPMKSVKRNFKV